MAQGAALGKTLRAHALITDVYFIGVNLVNGSIHSRAIGWRVCHKQLDGRTDGRMGERMDGGIDRHMNGQLILD